MTTLVRVGKPSTKDAADERATPEVTLESFASVSRAYEAVLKEFEGNGPLPQHYEVYP